MKKTKEKVEKQMYQEEGEEYFNSHLTPYMKQQTYVINFLNLSQNVSYRLFE